MENQSLTVEKGAAAGYLLWAAVDHGKEYGKGDGSCGLSRDTLEAHDSAAN